MRSTRSYQSFDSFVDSQILALNSVVLLLVVIQTPPKLGRAGAAPKANDAIPAPKPMLEKVSLFTHVACRVCSNSPSTIDIQVDPSNKLSFITT